MCSAFPMGSIIMKFRVMYTRGSVCHKLRHFCLGLGSLLGPKKLKASWANNWMPLSCCDQMNKNL